jgi:hypothetical protein
MFIPSPFGYPLGASGNLYLDIYRNPIRLVGFGLICLYGDYLNIARPAAVA